MEFFAHSINTLSELNDLEKGFGIEIDIRDEKGNLVLGHDPLNTNYQDLTSFLKYVNGRSIIANIKSERIEEPFINLLKKFSPSSNYFFLDSSFSMLVNKGKFLNFASRFSEYESIQTSISLINKNLIKWIWIDTFSCFPVNHNNIDIINSLQVRKCLTSPDLLGRENDIAKYAKKIKELDLKLDGICCKKNNIKKWQEFL